MNTKLGLRPWTPNDLPAPRSVPVTVIILTKNEAANIERGIKSATWANQIVVIDCGSTDATVPLAHRAGAEIVQEPWRGFAAQREFALRHPSVRHEWVYFLDADEWVSDGLAVEIGELVQDPRHVAYAQRFRMIFMDRWIKHCGWYKGSWIVRLMRRSEVHYGMEAAGERVLAKSVGRMRHDIVDEDRKGIASWLRKHVRYAELEVQQKAESPGLMERWRTFYARRSVDSRPLPRAIAKDLVYPTIPAKPAAMFFYMYVLRAGFLDGAAGLTFCLYHAWYRFTIERLRISREIATRTDGSSMGTTASTCS